MAKIQRSSIINNSANELLIQQTTDITPAITEEKVRLVYPVNHKFTTIWKASDSSTSGTSTIYTTPTDKDFFLTSISMSITKNATSDNTGLSLTSTIGGAAVALSKILTETLTASSFVVTREFPYPIKIDRGVAISATSAFTAGASSRSVQIGGFILE